MGKMTPEKAAKMLAEDGIVVTTEEAFTDSGFLRTLAKMAVAQYLRGSRAAHPNLKTFQNQIIPYQLSIC